MPRKIILHESHTTGGIVSAGADGFTIIPNIFQSLGSHFITDGVQAGDRLVIPAGPEMGVYTVSGVLSEQAITCVVGPWPVGGTPGIGFAIYRYNFLGLDPQGRVSGPDLGGMDYTECTDAGLFKLGFGTDGGPDDGDWTTLQRFMLIIDEANVTDINVHIIPPEGDAFTMPLIVDWAHWAGTGRSNTVQTMFWHGRINLRPGSQLRVRTTTCEAPQYCGVWWEKFHRVDRNIVTDDEYFVY